MRKYFWQSCILLLTLALTLLPLQPAVPQESWPPEPPDPQQVAALDQLSSWLNHPPPTNHGRQPLPPGFRNAIRQRSETFELLRAYNGPEANRQLLRQLPYGEAIFQAAREAGIDSLLLAAVVEAESNFTPTVVSPKGAVGLAQVMPATAQGMGDVELRHPATNLRLGARYLRSLIKRFNGNLELALAAYNAGPAAVDRFQGVPPYRETRGYVDKVLGIYFEHQRDIWTSSVTGELLVN